MATRPAPTVTLKSLAVPNEHGGWGFTLEPVILGLLVAPSAAGWGLGLMALASFFARHPTKLAAGDLRRGHVYPRTRLALFFALLYGGLALAGLLLAWLAGERAFLTPLLAALPLVVLQVVLDALGKGRTLIGELSGSLAMGGVATAIILAAGGDARLAWGAWLVLAMRGLVAIRYARAQVRRAYGKPVSKISTFATAVLGVFVLFLGAVWGVSPWLGMWAVLALAVYAVYMLERPPVTARHVGWSQMFFGWLVALLTALGIRAGW
ncbi:YwiC-like family protein [Oceanithermus desulfurans]